MRTQHKSVLPSLSMIDNTTKKDKEDLTEKEATNMAYSQFKLDQERKVGVNKRAGSPVITMRMLEVAPTNFFDNLKPLAKIATDEIISSISSTEASIHISNHRKDPTDMALKERILYIIMSEFNRVNSNNVEISLLKNRDKDILLAMVINEVIGLGPLEPLWVNNKVTEIMCNGPKDVQIEIGGIVRKIPSVSFRDQDHLKMLINKLYSSINKQLSPTNPAERGRLPDKSRIFAVHEVIAPAGPNFNIRKHSEDYWTVLQQIEMGTASVELMEYLGNLIHSGISYLVVGGTGTGKTTMLNSLTGFMPANARGITIEENLEMKPHPLKLLAAAMECIPPKAGDNKGGVTPRDNVRSALQMRPDTIFIGEVTDGAAYDLCQALNTGHNGASSVHANDAKDAIDRMRSLVSQEEFVRGPAVLDLIGSAFDVIIVIDRLDDGSRKIVEIVEIGRNPERKENGELTLNVKPLWESTIRQDFDEQGKIIFKAEWNQVNELSEYRVKKHRLNLSKKLSWQELLELSTYNVPKKTKEEEKEEE